MRDFCLEEKLIFTCLKHIFFLFLGGTHVAHCIPLGVKYIFWGSRLKHLLPPPCYILTTFGRCIIGVGNSTKWCTELEAPNFLYYAIKLKHGQLLAHALTLFCLFLLPPKSLAYSSALFFNCGWERIKVQGSM